MSVETWPDEVQYYRSISPDFGLYQKLRGNISGSLVAKCFCSPACCKMCLYAVWYSAGVHWEFSLSTEHSCQPIPKNGTSWNSIWSSIKMRGAADSGNNSFHMVSLFPHYNVIPCYSHTAQSINSAWRLHKLSKDMIHLCSALEPIGLAASLKTTFRRPRSYLRINCNFTWFVLASDKKDFISRPIKTATAEKTRVTRNLIVVQHGKGVLIEDC